MINEIIKSLKADAVITCKAFSIRVGFALAFLTSLLALNIGFSVAHDLNSDGTHIPTFYCTTQLLMCLFALSPFVIFLFASYLGANEYHANTWSVRLASTQRSIVLYSKLGAILLFSFLLSTTLVMLGIFFDLLSFGVSFEMLPALLGRYLAVIFFTSCLALGAFLLSIIVKNIWTSLTICLLYYYFEHFLTEILPNSVYSVLPIWNLNNILHSLFGEVGAFSFFQDGSSGPIASLVILLMYSVLLIGSLVVVFGKFDFDS
ncbi:MAG: ABC transporter permease [Coriobacteriales bacterium]|nr:ABC transporter permease [Coriobacteriales bacterium]